MRAQELKETIEEKVLTGERLTREDGIALFDCDDLGFLGRLANHVREKKSGDYAYFNVNRHINLTNVCTSKCKFCAFYREAGAEGAYTMTVEDALEAALGSAPLGITELHIVSALHPDLPFSYYVDVIRELKKALPDIHMQAFTAVEIAYFAKISGKSIREVLEELKRAGLGSMPGGGAEVFSSRVREAVCSNKATAGQWLEIMRTAHKLGIKSNATMLYGHIETYEERVDHLIRLRELQDETGGFQSFIPLAFHPDNTPLEQIRKFERPTAHENLKMIAISRLMLDSFDHIKAFWIMLGLKTAQLSLDFGADDLDGTVVQEKITHAAGADTDEAIERDELVEIIKDAGRIPVERDTLYRVVRIYDGAVA
ncbi:MAG: aminofutalosine synthase MqnE [Actinobacteria bacterium]|nr:aminofutalosine synthase MqnE [Actinomycetota bacterium]